MSQEPVLRLARRTVVKFIAGVAIAPALAPRSAGADATGVAGRPSGGQYRGPAGTLSDPDLVHPIVPWKLTLSESERATLAPLCDLILPADERCPAASALGAPAFVDEWISAPFEPMQEDAALVREGIAWLDEESRRRFNVPFGDTSVAQRTTIADTLCSLKGAPADLQRAALFFDRVRELTVIAVYTTREGMADLGFVGNVALDEWKAPPAEVLRLVGLAQS